MNDEEKDNFHLMNSRANSKRMLEMTLEERSELGRKGAKAFIKNLTPGKIEIIKNRMRKFTLKQNENMTSEQRSERARKAANIRWNKNGVNNGTQQVT